MDVAIVVGDVGRVGRQPGRAVAANLEHAWSPRDGVSVAPSAPRTA